MKKVYNECHPNVLAALKIIKICTYEIVVVYYHYVEIFRLKSKWVLYMRFFEPFRERSAERRDYLLVNII